MKAVLLCLSCFHWTLSYQHTDIDQLDKLTKSYCEDCALEKNIVYKGLVEPPATMPPSFPPKKNLRRNK